MIEAGLILCRAPDGVGLQTTPHEPPGRSASYLPDDSGLWTQLWAARDVLIGFAHSHPGHGALAATPSLEDVTTFSAIERALGRRLSWWITTRDQLWLWTWDSEDGTYSGTRVKDPQPDWLPQLLALSRCG